MKEQLFASYAVAGIGSVALGTVVSYPLDTIKLLIQVGSSSGKQLTATQAFHRLQTLSGYSGNSLICLFIFGDVVHVHMNAIKPLPLRLHHRSVLIFTNTYRDDTCEDDAEEVGWKRVGVNL
ncbi:hypothetical protein Patl1_07333 [Pistacia atlantica]|uniref:Uncharacterized protein n=1 Tax=Pistacia atlantica TaxID=434234 RepID=A0ACC1AKZ2_9ROSI|nr:hypothetical protein Patl1_07333 [Pistacia atlantica]